MVGRVEDFASILGSFISEPRLGTGLPPELTVMDVGLAAVGTLTVSTPITALVWTGLETNPALEFKSVTLGVLVATLTVSTPGDSVVELGGLGLVLVGGESLMLGGAVAGLFKASLVG